MTLYAYIMTHDNGRAPNPHGDFCTLAYCMPMTRRAAQCGDYVVGLAGAKFRDRGGEWHIIYAMRVTEPPISFNAHDERFSDKVVRVLGKYKRQADCVLVSKDFVYWGEEAKPLPTYLNFLRNAFYTNGKVAGIAHRRDFTNQQVQAFKQWFSRQKKGKRGEPFDGPRKKC